MSYATPVLRTKCPRFYFANDISAAPVNGLVDGDLLKITDTGDANGAVLEFYIYDYETGQWVNCDLPDVFRASQPLAAGVNTITHNLGKPNVEVEVRNAATGALISARVVAEAPDSVDIFVPVAVANANITVDA